MNISANGEGKVFVVMDDGRRDLTGALKFGDPKVLFKYSFYPDTASNREEKVLTRALRMLSDFDEGIDYLLLVGDQALIAVASAALVMLGKTKVRMLKYDRKKQDYYVINLDFDITLGRL